MFRTNYSDVLSVNTADAVREVCYILEASSDFKPPFWCIRNRKAFFMKQVPNICTYFFYNSTDSCRTSTVTKIKDHYTFVQLRGTWKKINKLNHFKERNVQQRWKTARDAYVRCKATLKNTKSGSAGGNKKKYVYSDCMQFLDKKHIIDAEDSILEIQNTMDESLSNSKPTTNDDALPSTSKDSNFCQPKKTAAAVQKNVQNVLRNELVMKTFIFLVHFCRLWKLFLISKNYFSVRQFYNKQLWFLAVLVKSNREHHICFQLQNQNIPMFLHLVM